MGRDHELLQAVREQDLSVIQKILQKNKLNKHKLIGSNKKLNVNFQDSDGMAALHQAALVGNVEIMRMLLDGGAAVDVRDNKGMRPIHYAAWQGKEAPVNLLLQSGSNTNEPADNGETPLHFACQHGHYDVVHLLLKYQAKPTIHNKEFKTPLDLACEFGRYRVAELLITSNLCNKILQENPGDLLDNKRTTCLHLAAKNGHVDIIRLLLQAGVDINRQTLQGTCLHEAALYGKIEVVKLLLDCGVDVNRPNSYDQTALDIVNKFTTSRAAKELKQLLKEASSAVQARAIKDNYSIYDPHSLRFREGDYITVLEQRPDGLWKGFVMHEGQMAKTGYFPGSSVVLVDRQAVENRTTSLRGSQPMMGNHKYGGPPDIINRNQYQMPNGNTNRDSYGSIGADESFPPPPSPMTIARNCQDATVNGLPPPHLNSPRHVANHQMSYSPKPPSTPEHAQAPTFDWPPRHLDGDFRGSSPLRSGSPCKSSPTNSNRNSSASLDSGRSLGSSQYNDPRCVPFVNVHIHNHRLSGQSYESGMSSRQSYHSTSSSSMGSLDRLEESGYSSQVNVAELFHAGYQDHEVLHAWLCDLHFEEYFNLFVSAGYDMGTITHMTPQDLTAIGITKPGHRKKLKAEIAKLQIPDGIPDYKPNDLLEWLQLLRFEQYYDTLIRQGYENIDYITDITWEDLEEIGISLLGHQKKMMLAIDRLKRIQAGARRLSAMDHMSASTEMLDPAPPSPGHHIPSTRWSADFGSSHKPSQEAQYQTIKPKRSPSGDSMSSSGSAKDNLTTFAQPVDMATNSVGEIVHLRTKQVMYQPDVVAIQLNRSMSRSSTSEGMDTAHGDSSPQQCKSFQQQDVVKAQYQFDGDVTPTNEQYHVSSDDSDGCGTLRRPSATVSPRVVVKPKPVAKIVAKTKRSSRDFTPEIIPIGPEKNIEKGQYDSLKRSNSGQNYDEILPSSPKEPIKKSPQEMLAASIAQSVAARGTNQPGVHRKGSPKHSPTPAHHSLPKSSGNGTVPSAKNSNKNGSKGSLNGSQGKVKKPPPPPKRTNSIKTDIPVVIEKRSSSNEHLTTPTKPHVPPPTATKPGAVKSAKPAPPQPKIEEQQPDFQECVKSLAAKFGKNTKNEEVQQKLPLNLPQKTYEPPSDTEEFPPPPPPIAFEEQQLPPTTKTQQISTTKNVSEKTAKTAANLAQASSSDHSSDSDQDFNSPVTTLKRKSSTSSNESITAVDSNTLPFANENVGTIKQRNPSAKPSIVSVSVDGESDLNSSLFEDNTGTIRRNPAMKDPPLNNGIPAGMTMATSGKQSGDVLNDIGDMLQGLTDELDAMLELELT